MKTACFTGHRVLTGDIDNLQERLYNVLERAILKGITDYYNGGAIGWDQLSAQTVIKLRDKYPYIKLHLILPCSPDEQSFRWNEEQKRNFYNIICSADSVGQVSQNYYNGCMKVRNQKLVDMADCCFCFFDKRKPYSGTGQTIRMALNKHIMIINFYSD